MPVRILLLVLAFLGLVSIDPPWAVPDLTDLDEWLRTSRPEDAAAGLLRTGAIALTGSQLAALAVVGLGHISRNGRLQSLGRRAMLPILRGGLPLALAAGTALPAAAFEVRLPIKPPVVSTSPIAEFTPPTAAPSVIVQPGDSMWTIAADQTDGPIGRYWLAVVELNRNRFADVDVIQPGDVVLLPPISPEG
jgi:nucleoid-associated protein YgaU